jgi:dihydrofolate synthase/folylpolyglutamate synthase
LLGAHQATNAALAVAAANELQLAGLSIPETAIATGLRTVRWPARMEVVRTQPTVILDTAHNVPSVEALVRTLDESLPGIGKKRLIFAVSSDKQYEPMLRLLAEAFDEIYLTKYGNNPRCVAPETLAELIAGFPGRARYSIHPTAKSAWDVAWSITKPDDLLAISGSVFLAGEMMPLLDDLRYG